MEILVQQVITGIAIGGIYALVALGFVLIYKSSQVLNFAQGQLLMGGAYVGWLMVMTLNIPFYVAFPLTIALSAVLGIVIERLALRPMIGEPIIAVIIVTLGLSSMLEGVILGVFGTEIRRIENLKSGDEVKGMRARVKVVKNKVAPPFRDAEVDILFGRGISREANILDVAVAHGVVQRTGTWFAFGDMKLGQGRDNARDFLESNPELAREIDRRARVAVGLAKPPAPSEHAQATGAVKEPAGKHEA